MHTWHAPASSKPPAATPTCRARCPSSQPYPSSCGRCRAGGGGWPELRLYIYTLSILYCYIYYYSAKYGTYVGVAGIEISQYTVACRGCQARCATKDKGTRHHASPKQRGPSNYIILLSLQLPVYYIAIIYTGRPVQLQIRPCGRVCSSGMRAHAKLAMHAFIHAHPYVY